MFSTLDTGDSFISNFCQTIYMKIICSLVVMESFKLKDTNKVFYEDITPSLF